MIPDKADERVAIAIGYARAGLADEAGVQGAIRRTASEGDLLYGLTALTLWAIWCAESTGRARPGAEVGEAEVDRALADLQGIYRRASRGEPI